jgi:hypothetical protein
MVVMLRLHTHIRERVHMCAKKEDEKREMNRWG